ncbi:unnamed protein product [Gemmataceae bacterium]|nr:unnamed protein product [Gemmataceae bacterium]VTT99965.1 unnamed protein product [Gemmataceae bacterium]
MSSRPWTAAALILLGTAAPAAAQPPSPLDLVGGIREAGLADLALEYLREVEPRLNTADKQVLPLERAKCLLEASEEEPDEGTRTSMVNEAKVAFDNFLSTAASHPRAAEASMALARLTSVEAKAQLNRARRMDVPARDDAGYDAAIQKQKAEMAKARPLFLLASKRFAEAATKMKARLDSLPATDPARAALTRETFDADLAAAINEYYLSETSLTTGASGVVERDKFLEASRKKFEDLAKGPPTSRTVWIARAWMAEVLADQAKPNDAKTEFAAILAAPRAEAEEGKRLARFFQIRREYLDALGENNPTKLGAVEQQLKSWLFRYGNTQKPPAEVIAARYYLAFALQRQGTITILKNPGGKLPDSVKTQFEAAEKLYRGLSQSDHDYTDRSAKNRMFVVRRLLGEADKPASEYANFEAAQMAALIQMAKLNDMEKVLAGAAELREAAEDMPFWAGLRALGNVRRIEDDARDRKVRVVALLERARELATERDNPADVTDNLIRLVYFYTNSDMPHQAAVLGEHIARTSRTTGGKAALAGLMALNGYSISMGKIGRDAQRVVAAQPEKAEEINAAAAAATRSDRERAIEVARLLDQKFPNDSATDSARHRLAFLLRDEGKLDQAFQAVTKIRSGYSALLAARQFEGALASALINPKEKEGELPKEKKKAIYRQAITDLSKVAKPSPTASKEDVQGWVACRLRLAFLYLTQNRADDETEKTAPGYDRALGVADELVAAIPAFSACQDKDKKLTTDGMEFSFQANDLHTRAMYLRAKSLVDDGKFDAAAGIITAASAEISRPLFDERMKKWTDTNGDAGDSEAVGKQKAQIAGLASGIDKVRRDIVMIGFKVRCLQGKKEEAAKMLETLKAAGGGVETNLQALMLMAQELSSQLKTLKKDGKVKEAGDLGAGLTLLLSEFTSVKELSPATLLFLGDTLSTIGEWGKAVEAFQKVPPPSLEGKPIPDWAKRKIDDYPAEFRAQVSKQIGTYRYAQLGIAKAYRGWAKFPEAEKLLTEAIGTNDKQGYAYSSLDFRKELGTVLEGKAATLTGKPATDEWGKALKEWTTLFQFAQNGLKQIKPDTPPEVVMKLKSTFFDSYFEIQRVLVTANQSLIKDPAKLDASFEKVGTNIFNVENLHKFNDVKQITAEDGKKVPIKAGTEVITPEVWTRYCDLLDKNPKLKAAYQKAGGKFFLERPKDE